MMNYDFGFFGMHMLWWLFWIILISILFGWFEPVPKKRIRKDSALDILQRRFASGEVTAEEYQASKDVLASDLTNTNN